MKTYIADQIRKKIETMSDDEVIALVLGAAPTSTPAVSSPRTASGPSPESARKNATRNAAVQLAVANGNASLAAIVVATGLSRSLVSRSLVELRREGKICQGGERRFARYATTQVEAERASLVARGLADPVSSDEEPAPDPSDPPENESSAA